MANDINGPLRNVLPGNIDNWNRVYATVADANAAIPSTVVGGRNFREGKVVQIGTVTDHEEYRWIGGFGDEHLSEYNLSFIESDQAKSGIADSLGNVFSAILLDGSQYPPRKINILELDKSVTQSLLVDDNLSKSFMSSADVNGFFSSVMYTDGSQYPPGVLPSKVIDIADIPDIDLPYYASDLIQDTHIIKNSTWNQWIEPRAVVDNDGNLYVSSVGNGRGSSGELWLSKVSVDGKVSRVLTGRVRNTETGTDDHNAIAILIDKRPDAPYPLILFQSEHGTAFMRYCKLTSLEPSEWAFDWTELTGDGHVSYAQCFRYGDEIIVSCRTQSRPIGAGAGTRGIRWYYSSDNANTWKRQYMFWKEGENWPYLLHKEKKDGSGLNIAINTHPIQSTEKGIFFLEMDWASGNIVNPANRNSPVANWRTAFSGANNSFPGINCFDPAISLQLYSAVGDRRKRMWDVSNSITGECLIVYQEVPDSGNTMNTFNGSKNRVISFDLSSGVKNFDIEIGEAGMPNERPVESNLYFSGMAIINEKTVCALVYKNQSMIDGETDTVPSDGESKSYIIDITDSAAPKYRVFNKSKAKMMRPIVTKDSEFLIYNDAKNYLTYNGSDIDSILVIEKINELI